MSWAAITILAVGAYLFKLGGVAIGTLQQRQVQQQFRQQQVQQRPDSKSLVDPETVSTDEVTDRETRLFDRLGQLVPPAVLFGLIASQTVSTEGMLVADARLAGVGVGTIAAWRQAPFWVVLLISAGTAAAVRSFTGIP